MLSNKCVIIGITGSIASYKIASLVSLLKKQNADVHTIMTKNATEFISPLTFETLSGNKCITSTFDNNYIDSVDHIELAKKADLILIAPATANIISKLTYGLADDILTTTVLAATCPKLIAPAMNTAMFENKITQHNLTKLKKFEFKIIEPTVGLLACKDVGIGKMVEPEELMEHTLKEIACSKILKNKNILISAGPTCEYIDPVRYITNPSSGKMGFSLAKIASFMGANVTLVYGNTTLNPPTFINSTNVNSAEEMFNIFKNIHKDFDIIIKSAAVSDFTPITKSNQKTKKINANLNIELKHTKDILKYLGENKPENQILCGFSMETENLIQNSKIKLINKNLDLIFANDLTLDGSGFNYNTNSGCIIDRLGNVINLTKDSKLNISKKILTHIYNHFISSNKSNM